MLSKKVVCFYFRWTLINNDRCSWKKVVQEQFVELKKQVEESECKKHEDDELNMFNERESSGNADVIDSDKESNTNIAVKSNELKVNASIGLYQLIENLEKHFSNDEQTKVMNEQTYQQFGHLLMRTLHRIRMYFNDQDIDPDRFYDNVMC